ncbi:unnamed protein product, partial [Owenia fusiformis]
RLISKGPATEMKQRIKCEEDMMGMLCESIGEWKLTFAELEKRDKSVMNEENEWKTRYECQREYNEALEKQIAGLRESLLQEKASLKRLAAGGKSELDTESMSEAELKKLQLKLAREKYNLESQLRDYEWRMDQEAKAYYRADEKRKLLTMDIKKARHDSIEQQEHENKTKIARATKKIQKASNEKRHLRVTSEEDGKWCRKPTCGGSYAAESARRKRIISKQSYIKGKKLTRD